MSKGIIDIDETFKHAFERFEDGYLFYPWRWSKGYKITEEEFESLKDWFRPIVSWPFMIVLALTLPIVLVFCVYAEFYWGWRNALDWGFLVLGLMFAAFIAYALAPQFAVLGRKPVAPRRSAERTDELQAKTTPWWILIGVPIMLALQLIINGERWSEYASAYPAFAIPIGILMIFGLYICARVVREKLRQRGD